MSRGHLENDDILIDLNLYWGLLGCTDNVTSSLGLGPETWTKVSVY